MTMPCQCCCHMLIVILIVLNALRHLDKLWVFPNVPIISLHALLLRKHILQAMMENTNIWPVPIWERTMNPHKPTHLDTKTKFIVKAHIHEFVAPKNFYIALLVHFKVLPINHDYTIFPCIPILLILPDNLVKNLSQSSNKNEKVY